MNKIANFYLFYFLFFSGYMHAHISYLAEDCQACLVLLTIDHDLFFTLSEAKRKITEVCMYSYNILFIYHVIQNIILKIMMLYIRKSPKYI
jgi:hypothetical protein